MSFFLFEMKSKHRTVALLTDFGLRDQYVGAVKGVILSRAPQAGIVDISHNVSPHSIQEAAFLLWSAYRYFPKGTIFVVIVDPEVGGKRRIICAQGGQYIFLAPDNGLLKYVFGELNVSKVVSIQETRFFLPHVSSTFHGRDIFAPVCSHLANGVPLSRLGEEIHPVTRAELFLTFDRQKDRQVEGTIVYIDHFGNIITNIYQENPSKGKPRLQMIIRRREVVDYFSPTYAEAPRNRPFMMQGSTGLLEVAVREGSAARVLRARIGDPVRLVIHRAKR